MHAFSKVLLLGSLLALIPDTIHGVYTKCGTNGYCVPTIYPICDGIAGFSECKVDEVCCVDKHGIHRPMGYVSDDNFGIDNYAFEESYIGKKNRINIEQ